MGGGQKLEFLWQFLAIRSMMGRCA